MRSEFSLVGGPNARICLANSSILARSFSFSISALRAGIILLMPSSASWNFFRPSAPSAAAGFTSFRPPFSLSSAAFASSFVPVSAVTTCSACVSEVSTSLAPSAAFSRPRVHSLTFEFSVAWFTSSTRFLKSSSVIERCFSSSSAFSTARTCPASGSGVRPMSSTRRNIVPVSAISLVRSANCFCSDATLA
ncbi:hypothetical protein D3C87_559490 [compost metagenome]